MSLLLKLVGNTATNPVAIHDYRHAGGLVVTSWTPVTPIAVQGINASYGHNGPLTVNAWSYVLSTSSAVDTPVNPGAGVLTFTGFAPTIAQTTATSLIPGAGSITFTGFAPTVARTANQALTPGAGSLTLTGFAPAIAQSANQALTPGAGSITFTGFAPTVAQGSGASYGLASEYRSLGSLQTTTWLADGLGTPPGTSLTPGAGSITFTGFAPSISQPQAVTPGAGSLTFTGYAPTVSQTSGTVTGISTDYRGLGSLQVNQWAYVTQNAGVQIEYRGFGSLQTVSWFADGVSVALPAGSTSLTPGAGSVTFTGFAPSVSQSGSVSLTPGSGSISFNGYAPTVVNSGVQQDTNLPGFDMKARRWYIRRNGRILLFNSAQDADQWMAAEQAAEDAIRAAQKTSRLARKRLRERVFKVNAAPIPEVVDQTDLELAIAKVNLPFDALQLIKLADLEQILMIQELARRMQDDEDIELLLLTM